MSRVDLLRLLALARRSLLGACGIEMPCALRAATTHGVALHESDSSRLNELEPIARALARAAEDQQWLEVSPDTVMPRTIDEAYAVQRMAMAFRDDIPRGWKIGATSPGAQAAFEVDTPFCGRVYGRDLYSSPATISRTRSDMLVLEVEFAFTVGKDLPPRPIPYSRAEVVSAMVAVHPAIEYVQSRYRARGRLNAIRSIADNAGQGALVVGAGVQQWESIPLPKMTVRLLQQNSEVAVGSGAAVLGDPVNGLVWLANFLREHDSGLKLGEVITTGACAKPVEVLANVQAVARFEQLGDVTVTLRSA